MIEQNTGTRRQRGNQGEKLAIHALLGSKKILYLISLLIFFGLWQLVHITGYHGQSISGPLQVIQELVKMSGDELAGHTIFGHLWISFRRVIIAFGIAVVIGVPLGVLMGFSPIANAIVRPVFELFKPMPPISWISLAILWFGISETSKVFIILIGALVPLIINCYNGIRVVDEELYHVIRMLGGNRRDEIIKVMFPASFPTIFAGLQISLSMAWGSVLAAEMVGAREGVGFIIIAGMNQNDTAMIFAGMVIIALTAFAISAGLSYLERWICPWKTDLN
ncbi:ABC transporter permease [Desulfosporosinus sp. PR]|uniref:ABC transporter permease n=1 Tax=Candidatus Desulfosporosinus nitrosoreducens TaxID=3401928 RepID=UPI0027F33CD6|nr:ABC transporter permease [Desulfosporosinus sp. PR]MDQ7095167.1 ABC transporter permease [Desulfosporosinus sp. PR]